MRTSAESVKVSSSLREFPSILDSRRCLIIVPTVIGSGIDS